MNFKINLIKNEVMPAARRRLLFFSVIIYVLIVSAFIVLLSYRVTSRIVDLAGYEKNIAVFRNATDIPDKGQKDIADYIRYKKDKILYYAKRLEFVDELRSGSKDLPYVLRGLSGPLAAGSYIDNINFNSKTGILEFDVIIPEGRVEGALNTDDLISSWKKDKHLMSCIKEIESAQTAKQGKGASSVWVSRFSCSLLNRGS